MAFDSFGWSVLLVALLLVVAIADIRTRRIPDALNASVILTGVAYALIASGQGVGDHMLGIIIGFVPLALFGELYWRLRGREGLGLGDAKLFAGAGAWLGWRDLPLVLLIASVLGLVAALIFRQALVEKGQIAFAPFIAAGIMAVWITTER